MILQPLHQLLLKQRIEHNARRFLDLGQHAVELLLGPHQDRHAPPAAPGTARSPPRDRGQRLAGRIGDEVKVEIAAGMMRHKGGTSCDFLGGGHGRRRSASLQCPGGPGLSTSRPWGHHVTGAMGTVGKHVNEVGTFPADRRPHAGRPSLLDDIAPILPVARKSGR